MVANGDFNANLKKAPSNEHSPGERGGSGNRHILAPGNRYDCKSISKEVLRVNGLRVKLAVVRGKKFPGLQGRRV